MVMWWMMQRPAGPGLAFHDMSRLMLASTPMTMMEKMMDAHMSPMIQRWRELGALGSTMDSVYMLLVAAEGQYRR